MLLCHGLHFAVPSIHTRPNSHTPACNTYETSNKQQSNAEPSQKGSPRSGGHTTCTGPYCILSRGIFPLPMTTPGLGLGLCCSLLRLLLFLTPCRSLLRLLRLLFVLRPCGSLLQLLFAESIRSAVSTSLPSLSATSAAAGASTEDLLRGFPRYRTSDVDEDLLLSCAQDGAQEEIDDLQSIYNIFKVCI